MATFVIGEPATFHTDFNKRDADGRLVAIPGGPGIYWLGARLEGSRVRLVDAEGNTCQALIDEIDGQILKFRPDWGTWRDAVHLRAVGQPTHQADLVIGPAVEATAGREDSTYVTPARYVVLGRRTAASVDA